VRGPDLSYLERADDPGELKRRTRELHKRMVMAGDSTFLPTAGVFLEIPYERYVRIRGGSRPPDDFTDEDARALYHVAHETVHVAQVVLCPLVFTHVKAVATAAGITAHLHSRRTLTPELLEEARAAVGRAAAALDDEKAGLTVAEILETHAVVQGIKWATATRDANSWYWAVETFHKGAAKYLRVLRVFARLIGIELAFELLPRFCLLSFQLADPRVALDYLLRRIMDESDRHAVSRLSGPDLCRWATADPEIIATSLRERDPSQFQDGIDWTTVFSGYFDLLEQVSGTEERLQVMLGSDFGARGADIFQPWYVLFGDGQVLPLHNPEMDVGDYEEWTRVTLATLETLAFLTSVKRHPPGEPQSS
jgi:hypothetical protein